MIFETPIDLLEASEIVEYVVELSHGENWYPVEKHPFSRKFFPPDTPIQTYPTINEALSSVFKPSEPNTVSNPPSQRIRNLRTNEVVWTNKMTHETPINETNLPSG